MGTANFGIAGLDWQQRVNWERMRNYRTERAREHMKKHGLGAMLCMYDENVRYLTGLGSSNAALLVEPDGADAGQLALKVAAADDDRARALDRRRVPHHPAPGPVRDDGMAIHDPERLLQDLVGPVDVFEPVAGRRDGQ